MEKNFALKPLIPRQTIADEVSTPGARGFRREFSRMANRLGVWGMKLKSSTIVLALSACILLFGCQARGLKTMPEELTGVWGTSAPKYEGCFVEIKKDSITFLNMDHLENIDSNTITKIEFAWVGMETLYTIHYKKGGEEECQFSFYYCPHEGGAIRFKNQTRIKWVKADARIIEELFT